jgi:hypothetical protein
MTFSSSTSHSILILFFIHLGVSAFFSHSPPSTRNWQTQVQVQRLRPPFTTNQVYTQCTIEESFIYYYACSPRFISALVSTFSLLVPHFVGCRQSLLSPVNLVSSRLVSSLSQFPVYISSSCESSRYECGVYWRIVSCLMSTVVVSWCRWRHICLWYSGYVGSSYGDFFSKCGSRSQESKHRSRSVGTTPCRGGDRLSCHGKVYEDECRVASCKYHLAKQKGMAHRWVTGRMLMQTILPLSSQD